MFYCNLWSVLISTTDLVRLSINMGMHTANIPATARCSSMAIARVLMECRDMSRCLCVCVEFPLILNSIFNFQQWNGYHSSIHGACHAVFRKLHGHTQVNLASFIPHHRSAASMLHHGELLTMLLQQLLLLSFLIYISEYSLESHFDGYGSWNIGAAG